MITSEPKSNCVLGILKILSPYRTYNSRLNLQEVPQLHSTWSIKPACRLFKGRAFVFA